MHHIVTQGGRKRENKILVHCHAGQGRTAIIIGAYLLYSGIASDPKEAIYKCRCGRAKLFSHKYNCNYLNEFYQYLKDLRTLFPMQPISLKTIMLKQHDLL